MKGINPQCIMTKGHDLAPCPMCGSTKAHHVYGILIECDECQLIRTDRYSLPSMQLADYDAAYFLERNAYLINEDEFLRCFENLTGQFEPFAKPGGRLLDVGCGAGFMMRVARQHGFDVMGCDVSDWANQHGRAEGFDVRVGLLEELAYPAEEFDVVVCNHTLEHVSSPIPFLSEINRILRVEGILVLGVPNIDSLMSRIMRERWGSILPDQHLWHFTPQTLSTMVERSGLKPVYLDSDYILTTHPNMLKRLTLKVIRRLGHWAHRDESITLIAKKNAI